MYNMDDGTPSIESAARTIGLFPLLPQETASAPMASRDTSTTGNDEEAENHTMTRMLEDPTGRLCQSLLVSYVVSYFFLFI